MCKWPIKWFAKIPNSDGSLVSRRLHDNGHTFDRGEKTCTWDLRLYNWLN